MKFKAKTQLIDFNLRRYLGDLDSTMQEVTKEAARKWLQVVLVNIPTWSGASRATFEKLANEVGYSVTQGTIRADRNRTSLGEAVSGGGLENTPTSWHFFYETDLRYLAHNEANKAEFGDGSGIFSRAGLTNPTPYRFQEAGKVEFESFAKNVLLPSPLEFIKGKRI